MRLQGVTGVSRGYLGLEEVTLVTKGNKGLQGVRRCYSESQQVKS